MTNQAKTPENAALYDFLFAHVGLEELFLRKDPLVGLANPTTTTDRRGRIQEPTQTHAIGGTCIILQPQMESDQSPRIDGFAKLPENWDSFGSGPISELAIKNAKASWTALQTSGITPDRISPTPDDSVLFELKRESQAVLMEFFGTGDIAVVSVEGETEKLYDFTEVSEAVAAVSDLIFADA